MTSAIPVHAFCDLRLPVEPRARGRAYGEALAQGIRGHVEAWLASLAPLGDPRAHVAALLRDTDFRPAIRRHAPDLLEEVEGIAEGAGVPADLVFALQLLDEEWAYRGRQAAKCSSAALTGGEGPTWIGQNMDLGAYTDGFQALLRIDGDAATPAALVFTTAGMIGLMGVNAAGVGVCVNSLPQLASAPEGLPVAFVLRRLLQARSLAEAAGLVSSLPHATNQHYLIGDPGAARSFEAGSAGVVEYTPPHPTRLLHTNHPLAARAELPEPHAARQNSEARLQALERRLGAGEVGLAQLQAALSSCDDPRNPVCRIPDPAAGLIGFTTGSMISALYEDAVECWVSPGPPSLHGYRRFELGPAEQTARRP